MSPHAAVRVWGRVGEKRQDASIHAVSQKSEPLLEVFWVCLLMGPHAAVRVWGRVGKMVPGRVRSCNLATERVLHEVMPARCCARLGRC